MFSSVHQRLAFVLVAATLAGCVTPRPFEPSGSSATLPTESTATPQTQAAGSAESSAPAPLPEPQRPRTLTPATRALVTQAQTQLNGGNPALAAATVERALRIEPDNPLLWIELAKIRQHEGNEAQAENLARKALTMAVGDNKTQAAAWRVIADSYRARGRNPEAREAEAKAIAMEAARG
jgi:predicted Zn-dependent protease